MVGLRGKGFTLVELVIVVLVVAILLALTLPSYQQHVRTMRRSLAGAALLDAMIRQEQYFLEHKRYAGTLTALAFPAHPYAIDPEGTIVAGQAPNRIYLIDLATRENAYTLFATPQLGQAADRSCGTLSLDSTGTKGASGERTARECW